VKYIFSIALLCITFGVVASSVVSQPDAKEQSTLGCICVRESDDNIGLEETIFIKQAMVCDYPYEPETDVTGKSINIVASEATVLTVSQPSSTYG